MSDVQADEVNFFDPEWRKAAREAIVSEGIRCRVCGNYLRCEGVHTLTETLCEVTMSCHEALTIKVSNYDVT